MGKTSWDEYELYRDLLVAMADHFKPSMTDLAKIAEAARAAGGWQFSNGSL